MGTTEQTLEARNREIQGCTECEKSSDKYNLKPWPKDRRVVFVGERPSVEKEKKKEIKDSEKDKNYENPKSGSDKLFRRMREECGFDKCYITDMVKCIGEAGSFEWEKAYKCPEMFLKREIEAIRPEVVVALGKTAKSRLEELLGPDRVIYIPHPRWGAISKNKEKFEESFKSLRERVESMDRGVV